MKTICLGLYRGSDYKILTIKKDRYRQHNF